MPNIKRIFFIFILIISCGFLYPQEDIKKEKITTVNVFLSMIYSTRLGWILEYYSDNEPVPKKTFLPTSFFMDQRAVKLLWDPRLAPQMNIIYKNGEPFKVKIYLPPEPQNSPYFKIIDYLTTDVIEKFKVDKLIFEF